MPAEFIPGLELSRRFYWQAVRPLLEAHFPELPHAAARIGSGSDVLGFDTPMSMDHDWGPAVHIFLRNQDEALAQSIREVMAQQLPRTFLGFSTHFGLTGEDDGTQWMQEAPEGPINHHVRPVTLQRFLWQTLRWDISQPLDAIDWLTLPSQALRGVTAGAVHHDGIGELTAMRQKLAWYPRDVWLYLLACGWQRIDQEQHLMPRAGYAGDELGSALMGARLARDVMHLGFLMERQYAPYPKWLGTAFQQLACAGELAPLLWQAQRAASWQERMEALSRCYTTLARRHNGLGITNKQPEDVTQFFDRPFQVISAEKFVKALLKPITDPQVLAITRLGLIGSLDQFSDSTDLRSYPGWRLRLRRLLEPGADQ